MKYTLTFGRNSQLVWALILPAFILLIPLLIFMEYASKELVRSDLGFVISTVGYMAATLFLTLKWVKSINAKVIVTIADGIIHFRFPFKNIFHRSDFMITFHEILNLGEDNDKGFDFLYFETTNPKYSKFHITAKEENEDFALFSKLMFEMEEEFNKQVTVDRLVTNKSIYQKWPMKILAFIFLSCWFVFPFLPGSDKDTWLLTARYWVFVALSSPIIAKVYYQNFGRKNG